MTTITVDFDTVYRTTTKTGWQWTTSEIFEPYHMRVEIEATARDDWNITQVWLIDRGPVKAPETNRYPFVLVPLEGKCLDEAVEFIRSSELLWSDLQEKVNFIIIPDDGWGEQGEAGRRL